jgi:hypothetical protein
MQQQRKEYDQLKAELTKLKQEALSPDEKKQLTAQLALHKEQYEAHVKNLSEEYQTVLTNVRTEAARGTEQLQFTKRNQAAELAETRSELSKLHQLYEQLLTAYQTVAVVKSTPKGVETESMDTTDQVHAQKYTPP